MAQHAEDVRRSTIKKMRLGAEHQEGPLRWEEVPRLSGRGLAYAAFSCPLLVAAQTYSEGDGDELCIRTISEHIMKASFNEEADTARFDVEAGPTIEPEIRARITLAGPSNVIAAYCLEIVDPNPAD